MGYFSAKLIKITLPNKEIYVAKLSRRVSHVVIKMHVNIRIDIMNADIYRHLFLCILQYQSYKKSQQLLIELPTLPSKEASIIGIRNVKSHDR